MGDNTSLYSFTSHTFTNAGATGPKGPTLAQVRSAYSSASWAQNNSYLNMTNDNGIQLWTVPATGSYTIRAIGASSDIPETYNKGLDVRITTILTKGEIIKIIVGQMSTPGSNSGRGGGGGSFVVRGTQTPILVAGGGGGRGNNMSDMSSNATTFISGQTGSGSPGGNAGGAGGDANGSEGITTTYGGGGGGLIGNGSNIMAGLSFINGGSGGNNISNANQAGSNGGFGGGGNGYTNGPEYSGGGGGGYSGGSGGYYSTYPAGGGGSYSITGKFDSPLANNNGHGMIVITLQSLITAPAPPSGPVATPFVQSTVVPIAVAGTNTYSSDYLNLLGNLKLRGSSYIDGNLIVNNNGTQVAGISNNGALMLKSEIIIGDNINNAWRLSTDGNNFLIQKSGEQGISITSKGVVTPVLNINTWTFPKF